MFNGYSRENSLPNNWLYQSKEWENDLSLGLYDSEWRQYDPWGVRTTTMDPHGESYPSLSPYSWAANNPLSIIDPDGQDIVDNAFGTTYTGTDAQNMFRQLQSQQSSRSSGSKEDPDKPTFYSFNSRTQARREQMVAEAEEREREDQPGFWAGAGDASMDFLGNIGGLFTGSTYPKIWGGIQHQWRRATDQGYNIVHTAIENNETLRFWGGDLSSYEYGYTATSTTLQYGSALIGPEVAGALGGAARTAFGPLKQWIRIGPSYSHYLDQPTKLSIRWGASPSQNWRFVKQIGDPTLRMYNQGLRNMKIPINNWRFKDPGHIHLQR